MNNILLTYGANVFFESDVLMCDVGRVISRNRNYYRIVHAEGMIDARVKGTMIYRANTPSDMPVVGDWVRFLGSNRGNEAMIYEICKRKSAISRVAFGRDSREILMAANIDYLLLCISLNNDFEMNRLERYLTALSMHGVKVVLLLTKADLQSANYILTW